MPKSCFNQKAKLFKLYSKLEKIFSELALLGTNNFVPIDLHNKIILQIYEIEENYLCLDTENCRHCNKINKRKFNYISINGIKTRLSIWIENEILLLV
jgi:hypothetical protein